MSRIKNAWNALFSPRTEKPTKASLPMPSSKHIAMKKAETSPVMREWVGDEQLRALAKDSEDKITFWVIAGDFAEFYSWAKTFNQGQPPEKQMRLELSNILSANLKELREKKWHDDSTNPFKNASTIVIDDKESFMRFFGLTEINDQHIRLMIGDQPFKTEYHGSVMSNTSLRFQLADGEWIKIEFGMGHLPEYFNQPEKTQIPQLAP